MASPQAEAYFNTFSPAEQQRIRASWGGQDLMDQWFANAQAAGAVQQQGESGYGTQGGGRTTPAQVRENATRLGLSEDYQRFSDAELTDWLNRWPYDPATGKFTNKWGDKVDKPDERGPNTPPGYNGTGDYFAGGFGGGGGRGGGGSATPSSSSPSAFRALENPLQAQLFDLFRNRQNPSGASTVGANSLAGGGVFSWGANPTNSSAAPAAAAQAWSPQNLQAGLQNAFPNRGTPTSAPQGGVPTPAATPQVNALSMSLRERFPQERAKWWAR